MILTFHLHLIVNFSVRSRGDILWKLCYKNKSKSYEKMQKAVRHEYNSINNQMGVLIKNGKYHSAHYQKLAGKKATYRTILDLFTFYGLEHTVEEISE